MKITDVKVFPVNEERLKAYVSITIDDCFVIRDLKVIMGPAGLFVAMPSLEISLTPSTKKLAPNWKKPFLMPLRPRLSPLVKVLQG
jgi:hypothetical protein